MPKKKSAVTSTNKQPAPGMNQTLDIRKPAPCEVFCISGNGVLRYCVHIQEYVGKYGPIAERYVAVTKPSIRPAARLAKPTLFREAFSDDFGRFAYPHILDNRESDQEARVESEHEAFNRLYGFWTGFEPCSADDDLYYPTDTVDDGDFFDFRDFADLLDAALLPDAIDRDDHPINLSLPDYFNKLTEKSYWEAGE